MTLSVKGKRLSDMSDKFCMCEKVGAVARDGKSTCMQCGGIDAYKRSPLRGSVICNEVRSIEQSIENAKRIKAEFPQYIQPSDVDCDMVNFLDHITNLEQQLSDAREQLNSANELQVMLQKQRDNANRKAREAIKSKADTEAEAIRKALDAVIDEVDEKLRSEHDQHCNLKNERPLFTESGTQKMILRGYKLLRKRLLEYASSIEEGKGYEE